MGNKQLHISKEVIMGMLQIRPCSFPFGVVSEDVESTRSPTLGFGWAHLLHWIATFYRTGTMHKHVLRKTGEFPHTPKWSECFLFKRIYRLVKKYERRAQCGSIRLDRIHTPLTYISSSSQCSHASVVTYLHPHLAQAAVYSVVHVQPFWHWMKSHHIFSFYLYWEIVEKGYWGISIEKVSGPQPAGLVLSK